jgi:hydrogenase expression/formation protein HypE
MSAFETILLGHGGGGALMDQLLDEVVRPAIRNEILDEGLDSGLLDIAGPLNQQSAPNSHTTVQSQIENRKSQIALTLDSYVVSPWKFPGGDIGRLAVCGTVNDLAVCGARPLGLALGLILAEGFERRALEDVMRSVGAAATEAGVKVITGDTKVVPRGQADGIFISTAGVGVLTSAEAPSPRRVRAGDVLLINGAIGDHGLAVMLAREMPQMRSSIRSDCAPLNDLTQRVCAAGVDIHFMRDATRAGLAGLAADLARATSLHVTLQEHTIPLRPETLHAAELLGLDVLEVANEGKLVMAVPPQQAEAALNALRSHPLGRDAAVIGQVTDEPDGICEIHTRSGGRRIVQKPLGEQLPRIC